MASSDGHTPARIGIVVHPSRVIDEPLSELREWATERGVELVQIPVPGQDRRVAEPGEAADCDLILSIGGDGTMLASMRAALAAGRPTLGVACGSLGVLTTVERDRLRPALNAFSRGDWTPRRIPGLAVACPGEPDRFALNDLAVLRDGIGQVRVTTQVDEILYSRWAGDGCVVSTPLGTSAYSLAAGGPLVTPDTEAFLLTPLPIHGGSRHALVISAGSRLHLEVKMRFGRARLEIDGQRAELTPESLTVSFRPALVTLVGLADQEPLFVSLRRRQIIADSPRIVADDGGGPDPDGSD